ncbi:hypothetical protein QBC39DRAFT_123659 [Podospora conica]|nr:hypothetical protein QBC39DRAFT_123659 [Schizothecium conicum]
MSHYPSSSWAHGQHQSVQPSSSDERCCGFTIPASHLVDPGVAPEFQTPAQRSHCQDPRCQGFPFNLACTQSHERKFNVSSRHVFLHLSSSSPSSSIVTVEPGQEDGMERLQEVILGPRVSSIADRRGTDRLQPLRTWSNIACQSVFSPIGIEPQPTDGPISTSPMQTSCIASRAPGSLVVAVSALRLNVAATVVDSEHNQCGPTCQ